MRELTEADKRDLRAVCAQYADHAAKLEAGGRWMAAHWVLHWTSADIESIIGTPKGQKPTKKRR